MSLVRMAAVAAPFDRDLDADFSRIARLIVTAREQGVRLLALPEACLGGYLPSLAGRALEGGAEGPPPLLLDGPEIRRLAALARDIVVTAGYCELAGGQLYNSVVCVTGDGVLGNHRKVHQPLAEDASYQPGDTFGAFDTPVGRLGMMICYDKAFPESARALALAGAEIVTCVSAWPGSRTKGAADLSQDRWTHIVWLSANQSGTFGELRFVASAKVVGPGGEVLASTGTAEGMALAELDVREALETARRSMAHLRNRRPEAYYSLGVG